MFIDARSVEANQTINTEICIIGAGPAGITLAKEFAGAPIEICLLESGGFTPDPQIQALNNSIESVGDQIPPCPNFPGAHFMRNRQFGGTSNAWDHIRYVPLEAIDFEKRDWLPYSGWPITKRDLDPYYQRAQEVCGLDIYSYEPEDWESPDAKQIFFNRQFLINRMFQFGPTDIFARGYREMVQSAPNITAYLHASVYELDVNETAQTVTRAKVLTPEGKQFWVTAKQFVLATGGIENARILLLSNRVQKTGLGNQYDLVGRFLMDHPLVRVGGIRPASRETIHGLKLYDIRKSGRVEVQAKPILSPEAMQREQLLNANFFLLPRHFLTRFNPLRLMFPNGKSYVSPAVSSGIILSRKLRHGQLEIQDVKHLMAILGGLDDILYFQTRKRAGDVLKPYWTRNPKLEKSLGMIQVYSATEQAPCPDNRVILGDEKDQFGYPKVQLLWRWDELSRRSFVKAATLFKEEVARAGLGKLSLELDKGNPQPFTLSTHHNMGTTRMHEDPKQGVVDANCQVHGISNLFIAGSSTFPTGGYANPTLTIVALSIRLADHIKTIVK